MRLPDAIEREIRAIEAGSPRLRGLRASIEIELQRYQTVLRDYLAWGAMTGSDRDLFESKFRELLQDWPEGRG